MRLIVAAVQTRGRLRMRTPDAFPRTVLWRCPWWTLVVRYVGCVIFLSASCLSLCTIQMAVQVVYQRTHPMYFSGRAVYVVAFSLRSNGSREQLYAHLMNVTVRCPDACILVVGTHADQVSAMPASLSSWKREFPQVRAVIP